MNSAIGSVKHILIDDSGINEIIGKKVPSNYKQFINGILIRPTNFIYEIVGNGQLNINEINAIEEQPKTANRISKIKAKGFEVKFRKMQSDTLQLIDSDLPQILSELLLLKYSTPGLALMSNTLQQLTANNPLNFDLSQGHPFYSYKIKHFLTDVALGMMPSKVWTGELDATGGIIIVKENGDLVCYHIYNKNEFQDYLVNNTKLEQPSTSEDDNNPGFGKITKEAKPYKFGWAYEENGELFIKLNLQIRFL